MPASALLNACLQDDVVLFLCYVAYVTFLGF